MTKAEKEMIVSIKKMRDIQGDNLIDDYMVGLYNGLELALCTLETRDPEFKEFEEEKNDNS